MSKTFAAAARVVHRVLERGETLDRALANRPDNGPDPAKIQALAYDAIRWQPYFQCLLQPLLKKPLRRKDGEIMALLLIAAHQLLRDKQAPHAVVNSAVNACAPLQRKWAKSLVNAVLRGLQRQPEPPEGSSPAALSAHPEWLHTALATAWPEHLESLLAANNAQAPMTLRVNTAKISREDYLAKLTEAGLAATPGRFSSQALVLQAACPVSVLPGFDEGLVSVQDEAAQLSADLLDCQPAERVLDACAAPGGKTCHLLERTPDLQLTALDQDDARLDRLRENLRRLALQAVVKVGDARDPDCWYDGAAFDRILVDAPCSGTGVIRRHPDIKVLRRDTDIEGFQQQQREILTALWPRLKPGGRLLYATCSVLPQENEALVAAFMADTDDAHVLPVTTEAGFDTGFGRQLLPGDGGHDGFYYCIMEKRPALADAGPSADSVPETGQA